MNEAGPITVHGTAIEPSHLVLITTAGMPAPRVSGYELVSLRSYNMDTVVRRYRRIVKMTPGTSDPRD